ncbi:APC family permease [Microbacterium oxydans]|uniref:APC family permease n=1 Tax=Microbacterium oxydans TaxID=82380 RepID=UPI0022B0CF9F|nr:APC family permease [Microbacterium oxydans]MCZ4302483.1 APC family permease [Microbacterium oxydans]
MTEQITPRLARTGLGVADMVFFVVAAAAPLTVVAGIIPLAIRTGGMSAAYGYLVPGLVLVLFAVGFTAMSPFVRNAGAFYSYISYGLGKPMGVGGSILAVVSYNAMTICLIAAFAVYGQSLLLGFLGIDLPWWLIAAVGVAGITLLGYFKVTLGAKVLGIALLLEVIVLVIYEVVVLATGGAGEGVAVEVFAPSVMLDPGFGAMLVLTAGGFIGFEATALYAEEAHDPQRTVPRATYIAIGFLALFYTISVWVIFIAYGTDGALETAASDDVSQMVFSSMAGYVGTWLADAGQLLLCTSSFAAALAFHNAAARYHFTLGRERILPAAISRVSASHGSPVGGVILQAVITVTVLGIAALVGADPYLVVFLWSAAPGVLGILLLEAIAAVAIVAFFWRDRRGHGLWRVILAPALAAAGLLTFVVLSVVQLDLLTAATPLVNALLVIPLPLALVLGITIAIIMKRRDPAQYARLNSIDAERETLAPASE